MQRLNTIAVIFSVLMLGACDMSVPSAVNTRQIQLREAVTTTTIKASPVDSNRVVTIARDYAQNGRGPLALTISYAAAGGAPALAAAQKLGRAYDAAFGKAGVSGIEISYADVADKKDAGQAVIAYTALTASAPKDCGRLPGHQGAVAVKDMDGYGIGCETARAESQMISDPSDLMGKAGLPDDDSRRQGAVVENYKAGKPNPKMEGLTASSVSSSASAGGGGK